MFLPLTQAILNALFDIGFGKERVDALLDLNSAELPNVDEPKQNHSTGE